MKAGRFVQCFRVRERMPLDSSSKTEFAIDSTIINGLERLASRSSSKRKVRFALANLFRPKKVENLQEIFFFVPWLGICGCKFFCSVLRSFGD